MSDDKTQEEGERGGQQTGDGTKTAAAPEPTPTLRLAHHPTLKRAKTIGEGGGTEPLLRSPVTFDGEVNIYGFPPIYFPPLEVQVKGFAPLFVARRDGRPVSKRYDETERARVAALEDDGGEPKPLNLREVKTAAGVTLALDTDSAQEATRVVREHFAGIYRPVEGKGE